MINVEKKQYFSMSLFGLFGFQPPQKKKQTPSRGNEKKQPNCGKTKHIQTSSKIPCSVEAIFSVSKHVYGFTRVTFRIDLFLCSVSKSHLILQRCVFVWTAFGGQFLVF
jgi:hypothetical protein